jgi:TonB family protein
MNASLTATYFDGETLRSHPVTVQTTDQGQLHVVGATIDRWIPAADVRISDRLGHVPFFLRLPDDGVLEVPCDDAAVAMLDAIRPASALSSLIHRLESHSAIAAAATLLLALTVAGTLWQGLPRLALRAAYAVPVAIETEAGRAGYAYFARAFPPTELTRDDRGKVYHALERLTKARALHVKPSLVFFHMNTPNAFALPGGIIVVTDELVQLAQNNEELAAVLAHELGHVEKRHGLQSVLRNSSALIVVSTVTGDLSTLSTFSGTLPFLLLQYGYDREFEREADAYAVGLLHDAHIDPINLATILQRLEKSRPAEGPDFSYLSTHPATEERVKFVQSFGAAALVATSNAAPPAAGGSNRGSTTSRAPTMPLELAGRSDFKPVGMVPVSTTSTIPGEGETPVASPAPDNMPYPLVRRPPFYPETMRHAGITGEVVVDFIVDAHGNVQNAHVIRSTQADFEAAALNAVRTWKFQPGVKNSRAVNVHLQVPVRFTMESQ